MKEMFENKILDEVYEIREEEVEKRYLEKYGKPKNEKKADNAEKELVEFMKKFIKDEKDMKELFNRINRYELATTSEMSFWHKPYYKTGFIDGISFKKQIEEEKITDNNREESVIYQNINEISDYFEEKKYKNLKENEDYKKVTREIEEIKKKFPKVRKFLEDDEITEFTTEEMRAMHKIIALYDDRAMYEADEMFKIGLREGKSL